MVKPVRVRFVVEPTSLKELEKLFDKFKLNWDDKVFKKVDDLSVSLDKLQKTMHDVWYQNAHKNLRNIQNPTSGNADLQKLINQMVKEFETQTQTLVTSIDKTTQAIDKLELGAGKAGDSMMSFEEKMDLMKEATNRELSAIEARQQGDIKRYKMREALSDKEEQGRKERLASRGWMNMFGGSGSIGGQLTKVFEPLVKGMVEPMSQAFKLEEFQKTPEGQKAEQLKYAQGGAPLNKMLGQGMYQGAGIADPDKARASGGGRFGGLKKWIGGRAEAGKKGGIAGMLGGAKGMAMMGGAMVGVKILQKAISLGIESSPMMQQMLKLWKFGIMMIFRPIGDFFGFFLRPIFIALLRKFIIPFYQKYLPIMQELGASMGANVAETLIWILEMLTGIRAATDSAFAAELKAQRMEQAHAGVLHADMSSLITTAESTLRDTYQYNPDANKIDRPNQKFGTVSEATMKEEMEKSIDANRLWWEQSGLLENQPPWLVDALNAGANIEQENANNVNSGNVERTTRYTYNVYNDNDIDITDSDLSEDNIDDKLIEPMSQIEKHQSKNIWRTQ